MKTYGWYRKMEVKGIRPKDWPRAVDPDTSKAAERDGGRPNNEAENAWDPPGFCTTNRAQTYLPR